MSVTLTDEDVQRLIPLLENAMAEVDVSAQPDAMIQPDDPMSLMDAYDWAKGLLARLGSPVEPYDPHVTAPAKCRMCNHKCQIVAPVGTDLDALECPNCHRMTLEVASE